MRGRKPNILQNDIKNEFCQEWFGRDEPNIWPLWIDDIVSGVARLDWYGDRQEQRPLSTSNIILCFTSLDEISTMSIKELLDTGTRQAERYNKACRMCYIWFKKSLESDHIKRMRYPQVSIVSEDHGVALSYNSTINDED